MAGGSPSLSLQPLQGFGGLGTPTPWGSRVCFVVGACRACERPGHGQARSPTEHGLGQVPDDFRIRALLAPLTHFTETMAGATSGALRMEEVGCGWPCRASRRGFGHLPPSCLSPRAQAGGQWVLGRPRPLWVWFPPDGDGGLEGSL